MQTAALWPRLRTVPQNWGRVSLTSKFSNIFKCFGRFGCFECFWAFSHACIRFLAFSSGLERFRALDLDSEIHEETRLIFCPTFCAATFCMSDPCHFIFSTKFGRRDLRRSLSGARFAAQDYFDVHFAVARPNLRQISEKTKFPIRNFR